MIYKIGSLQTLISLWLTGILVARLTLFSDGPHLETYLVFSLAVFWPCAIVIFHANFGKVLGNLYRDFRVWVFVTGYSSTVLISLLINDSDLTAVGYLITFLLGFFLSYALGNLTDMDQVRIGIVGFGAASSVVLAIYMALFWGSFETRLHGGILNPNQLGIVCVAVGLSAVLCRIRLYTVIVFCSMTAIILTAQSRASLLALSMGTFYILIFGGPSRPVTFQRLSGWFLVMSLIVLLSNIYWNPIRDVLFSVLALNDPYRGLYSGFSGRMETWTAAMEVFYNKPLFGTGYRNHQVLNGYITILAETGLAGFTFFLFFTFCALKRIISRAIVGKSNWAAGFVLSYLFIAFFEPNLMNMGNPLSVIALLLMVRAFSRSGSRRACS